MGNGIGVQMCIFICKGPWFSSRVWRVPPSPKLELLYWVFVWIVPLFLFLLTIYIYACNILKTGLYFIVYLVCFSNVPTLVNTFLCQSLCFYCTILIVFIGCYTVFHCQKYSRESWSYFSHSRHFFLCGLLTLLQQLCLVTPVLKCNVNLYNLLELSRPSCPKSNRHSPLPLSWKGFGCGAEVINRISSLPVRRWDVQDLDAQLPYLPV